MPGDGDGAPEPGSAVDGIVAGTLLEARGIRALDDQEADPDAGDRHPPDRRRRGGVCALLPLARKAISLTSVRSIAATIGRARRAESGAER